MGDLRGADAEGIGPEGAMGRGMAVAADHGQSRQGQALLGPDDMDDALARIVQAEELDAVTRRVGAEIVDHPGDLGIGDVVAPTRRHIVVGDAEGQAGLRDAAIASGNLGEGVERTLMHEMPVDPEQRVARGPRHDDMGVPELVEQGTRRDHDRSLIHAHEQSSCSPT